jgi:hypothetical protein
VQFLFQPTPYGDSGDQVVGTPDRSIVITEWQVCMQLGHMLIPSADQTSQVAINGNRYRAKMLEKPRIRLRNVRHSNQVSGK